MLTVSVLNYRNWRATERCIQDLLAACEGLDYRILVRDNSESSELAKLRAAFTPPAAPTFFFASPENPGFGRGHNLNFRAVHHGDSDTFLILNNDISISDPEVIAAMLQAGAPRKLVSCVLMTADRGDVWFAGGSIHPLTGDLHVERTSFSGPYRSTEFISGCCMMVPAALYELLGGFDERFFMYAEDLDICLRARIEGAESIIVNRPIIHEVGSGENGAYSDLYLYENTRNRFICLRRHRMGFGLVAATYFILKYGIARSLQLVIYSRNPARQIWTAWRGLVEGAFSSCQCRAAVPARPAFAEKVLEYPAKHRLGDMRKERLNPRIERRREP
jgi:GT2 family glycosyltransferase